MAALAQRRSKPEAEMSHRISAKCPATGQTVATEIVCDSDSITRIAFLVATENCPACGASHSWRKSETFLADATPLAAAA